MITDRDLAVLHALCRYYVLSRAQISALLFPDDASGRITRRRLQRLVNEGLISRMPAPMFNPRGGDPWPAYYPSKRGCEALAEVTGDDRFYAATTQPPLPYHLQHWLAISDTHIRIEAAIAGSNGLALTGWFNEWDVVNPDEQAPERRFRLYTLLSSGAEKKLVCAPDAAFMLTLSGHSKVFYLEQDRNTSGARQVAASKSKGYATMDALKLHRRHFPSTTLNSFTVLLITTTPQRRDALRRAFKDAPGKELWKLAAINDLTPEKLLFEPVWFGVEGDAVTLIKPEFQVRPSDPAVQSEAT